MKIDLEGRKFIYSEEGVRLKAYKDVVGIPTIGVGFTYYPGTGKKVEMGDTITQGQCDDIFTHIISTYEQAVTDAVKITLNQHQFNALVSFTFNVGTAAFKNSTLLKLINANASEDAITNQFLLWKKAGGKVVEDLLERRKREAALYFKQP